MSHEPPSTGTSTLSANHRSNTGQTPLPPVGRPDGRRVLVGRQLRTGPGHRAGRAGGPEESVRAKLEEFAAGISSTPLRRMVTPQEGALFLDTVLDMLQNSTYWRALQHPLASNPII